MNAIRDDIGNLASRLAGTRYTIDWINQQQLLMDRLRMATSLINRSHKYMLTINQDPQERDPELEKLLNDMWGYLTY